MPGNYLGAGIGIVYAVLGRRILEENQDVFLASHEDCSQSTRAPSYIAVLILSLSKHHT